MTNSQVENIMLGKIMAKYNEFEHGLMKQGRLPMWNTGIGFWSGAPCRDIYELFNNISLEKYMQFIDLGSGDGRVVLIASMFTNAVGIEIDKQLAKKAVEIKSNLGINNAVFHNKNFFEHDVSGHDIIFVNPDTPMQRGLESKLLKEMRGKLIVFGHHFHPSLFIKEKEFWINENFAAIYKR